MAAPNILSLTTINLKTAVLAVTTSATAIVTNSAASGKVYIVEGLRVTNVDGAAAADVTVDHYRSSTARHIAYTIPVPPDSSLVLITRDAPVYLEEGDSIRLTASANSDLEAICSYQDAS